MTHVDMIMELLGCDEQEARQIADIEDGRSDGDFIEVDERELAEFLGDDSAPGEQQES